MKMNTSGWREFALKDLGFSIHHGTRIKKSDRKTGNIIFLTAGKENQGVAGTIGNNVEVWHNPITVDMFGNCFYHPYNCAGDDNIYAFVNETVPPLAKSFIAALVNAKNGDTFAYINQFRQGDADALAILLPVTSSGEPDWQYMEKYIQHVQYTAQNRLVQLKAQVNSISNPINISDWKEFSVGDFFTATRGKSANMQRLAEGTTPLIAAARANQGVAGYYGITPTHENKITVSCNGVGCGSTFYHNYAFAITGDAIVLTETIPMSDAVKFFLTAIFDSRFSKKYSYEDKCSADKILNEHIPMPVTSSGEPDWQYMEKFLANIKFRAQTKLIALQKP